MAGSMLAGQGVADRGVEVGADDVGPVLVAVAAALADSSFARTFA